MWVSFVFVLGGLMALAYGFTNVPAVPSAPVPLADVLMLLVLGALVLTGARKPAPFAPFALATLIVAWASLRLPIDYRTWGTSAVRDYTTYLELGFALYVGYWLVERVDIDRWVRALTWIFGIVVIYGLLTFIPGLFSNFNIDVGLQRSVPLLGSVSKEGVAAAFFFFALVRPIGRLSLLVAALTIPLIVVAESRGVYLAIPVTVIALLAFGLVNGGQWRFRLRRLGAALVVMLIMGGLALTVAPAGRFGRATPALVLNQLKTLTGGEGVGAGSLNARTHWFHDTVTRVFRHPDGVVQGLGLGPDLANGFKTGADAIAVRKPHDDYLEIFARLGLPTLVAYVALLALALRSIARSVRRMASPRVQSFQVFVVANSVLYLFMSATQPLLAYSYGTIPLFALMGAGLAVGAGRSARGEQP
jgi:hypothetical protein